MRILWDNAGLRVTLIARRVTTSRVMFQNPVLGAVILAGNLSKARRSSGEYYKSASTR
jgi:hypothetical protein